jgi:glycosyltransferase involved in cell wall biosynthesis
MDNDRPEKASKVKSTEELDRSKRLAGLRVLHVLASGDDEFSGPGNVLLALLPIQSALRISTLIVAGYRRRPGILLGSLGANAQLKARPHQRYLERIHGSAGLVKVVVKEVARSDVVVAHSFFNLPVIVACLAAHWYRRPLIVTPHGCLDDFDTRKHERLKAALAPLWRRCLEQCVIWCMTERERDELKTYGARVHPMVVPPNVMALIDRTVPVAGGDMASHSADGCVVSFVGRINYKKGLPRLIDAFDKVASDSDSLIIAGSGDDDYVARIATKVEGMRRRDQIQLIGWVSGNAKRELLMSSDIFALLSDRENFAISVAEAMASGVAVLVTDEVALSDLVQRYGAGVVTSGEPHDIERQLQALMTDKALRAILSANAVCAIDLNFSETNVSELYGAMILAACDTNQERAHRVSA